MRVEFAPRDATPDIRIEVDVREVYSYITSEITRLSLTPAVPIRSQRRRRWEEERQQIEQGNQRRVQRLSPVAEGLRQMLAGAVAAPTAWDEVMPDPGRHYLAAILEHGCGTVVCPSCCAAYAAADLLVYDWSEGDMAGRLLTCPHDHVIVRTTDRMGEFVDPPKPFTRRLRKRSVTQGSSVAV